MLAPRGPTLLFVSWQRARVSEDMVRLSDRASAWTATGSAVGTHRPGMVFLHGGAGMWDYLGPVADMVADSFRTHRYDQRGWRRSSASHSFGATPGLE